MKVALVDPITKKHLHVSDNDAAFARIFWPSSISGTYVKPQKPVSTNE